MLTLRHSIVFKLSAEPLCGSGSPQMSFQSRGTTSSDVLSSSELKSPTPSTWTLDIAVAGWLGPRTELPGKAALLIKLCPDVTCSISAFLLLETMSW